MADRLKVMKDWSQTMLTLLLTILLLCHRTVCSNIIMQNHKLWSLLHSTRSFPHMPMLADTLFKTYPLLKESVIKKRANLFLKSESRPQSEHSFSSTPELDDFNPEYSYEDEPHAEDLRLTGDIPSVRNFPRKSPPSEASQSKSHSHGVFPHTKELSSERYFPRNSQQTQDPASTSHFPKHYTETEDSQSERYYPGDFPKVEDSSNARHFPGNFPQTEDPTSARHFPEHLTQTKASQSERHYPESLPQMEDSPSRGYFPGNFPPVSLSRDQMQQQSTFSSFPPASPPCAIRRSTTLENLMNDITALREQGLSRKALLTTTLAAIYRDYGVCITKNSL